MANNTQLVDLYLNPNFNYGECILAREYYEDYGKEPEEDGITMTGKQWMVEWITDEGATNQTIYDNYTDAKKRFDTLNSYKYRRKKKYSEVHMYSRIITSWQEIKE